MSHNILNMYISKGDHSSRIRSKSCILLSALWMRLTIVVVVVAALEGLIEVVGRHGAVVSVQLGVELVGDEVEAAEDAILVVVDGRVRAGVADSVALWCTQQLHTASQVHAESKPEAVAAQGLEAAW